MCMKAINTNLIYLIPQINHWFSGRISHVNGHHIDKSVWQSPLDNNTFDDSTKNALRVIIDFVFNNGHTHCDLFLSFAAGIISKLHRPAQFVIVRIWITEVARSYNVYSYNWLQTWKQMHSLKWMHCYTHPLSSSACQCDLFVSFATGIVSKLHRPAQLDIVCIWINRSG